MIPQTIPAEKLVPAWHREFCFCGARMSLIQAGYNPNKQVFFCVACGNEKPSETSLAKGGEKKNGA